MAFPEPAPEEMVIGPHDLIRGLIRAGYQYTDYATFATGVAEVNYVIGTNAYGGEPVRLLGMARNPMVAGSPGFVADEMAIVVTQDTLIRINNATSVQEMLLAANSPYVIRARCFRLYAVRSTVNGVLYLIAEGNGLRMP